MLLQSNSEAKRALYILFHCVLLAWNLDQAELIPREQWPTPALWHAVLVCDLSLAIPSYLPARI